MMLKVVPREPARDTSAKSSGNDLYYRLCYISTRFLYIREWRPYSTGFGDMSSFALSSGAMSWRREFAREQRHR